jgi:hypothetical protein
MAAAGGERIRMRSFEKTNQESNNMLSNSIYNALIQFDI